MGETPDLSTSGDADVSARPRPAWRRVAWWSALVTVIAVAVPASARLIGWEAGPLAWLVAVLPWFTLACVVPAALALLARSWTLAAASVAVAALGLVWLAPLYVAEDSPGESTLTVATSNLLFGQADADAVVAMVRERDVDVLAVQELTPEAVTALRAAGIETLLPHSVLDSAGFASGSGLWSRFPLEHAESVAGMTLRAVRAEANVDGTVTALLSVHPVPPGLLSQEAWRADMARLADVIDAETGATIVCGDFNSTRDHRAFRKLEDLGYVDAPDQAGAGLVPTFPEGRLPTPVAAIDHCIVRNVDWVATGVSSVSLPGTDHRALVVTYSGK